MPATIPIAFALGALTIWQLYLVGFINGIFTVFFDVADQSYLPTVLEKDELVDGNSKLQISQSAAQILGQPFGGGVIAVLTAPIAILVDAVSFIGSDPAGGLRWCPRPGPAGSGTGPAIT